MKLYQASTPLMSLSYRTTLTKRRLHDLWSTKQEKIKELYKEKYYRSSFFSSSPCSDIEYPDLELQSKIYVCLQGVHLVFVYSFTFVLYCNIVKIYITRTSSMNLTNLYLYYICSLVTYKVTQKYPLILVFAGLINKGLILLLFSFFQKFLLRL